MPDENDISIFDDFNEFQYNDMYKFILNIIKKYNYNHSIIKGMIIEKF